VTVIDCLGQLCPVPVIELAKALPTVAVGDVIELLSDDPAAAVDIPAWCRMRGQSFEGAEGSSYKVRRVS
jgi:tRNA 2-thiouridine synthesizing protein A